MLKSHILRYDSKKTNFFTERDGWGLNRKLTNKRTKTYYMVKLCLMCNVIAVM